MNDVEQRLRSLTREVPVAGGELDHVVGRGRVVRRRRAVASAGAGVAVLVAAVGVMSVLARPEPLPYVENSPAPSASASPAASPTSPADGAIDLAEVALPLGLVDDAGLHPNDLADAPEVDAELSAVVADGSGGVLYQRADDPRSIHWRHADGSEEDPVTVQPGPTILVGAVRWDGALYVAFTVPETDSEVPAVRLMLHRRPEPGSEDLLVPFTTDLVVDGDVPGVALLPDGRLVASACHLACTSHTVDLVEAAAVRQDLAATAVDDDARMIWGLDGTHQGSLVTVESELPGPLGRAFLEVFEVEDGDPSRTELPVGEGDTGAACRRPPTVGPRSSSSGTPTAAAAGCWSTTSTPRHRGSARSRASTVGWSSSTSLRRHPHSSGGCRRRRGVSGRGMSQGRGAGGRVRTRSDRPDRRLPGQAQRQRSWGTGPQGDARDSLLRDRVRLRPRVDRLEVDVVPADPAFSTMHCEGVIGGRVGSSVPSMKGSSPDSPYCTPTLLIGWRVLPSPRRPNRLTM